MVELILSAVALGLAAGTAPGPMLTLVAAATLRGGLAAGVPVALAPLVSDGPVIAASLFAVNSVAGRAQPLGWLGVAGAVYLLWLAVLGLRGSAEDAPAAPGKGLRDAVLVNLANPHPWLFWFAVGAPMIVAAGRLPWTALAFCLPFYVLLVGSKVVLAVLIDRTRHRLSGAAMARIQRALCLAMAVIAVSLLADSVALIRA